MSTYLQLVNKLRNKFGEVNLTTGTWTSTVGFDQFTKEAINYAYHDILNAEMEWPFLHQSATLTTTPGIQFYTPSLTVPSGFTSPAELKEIDWESFYINTNETHTTISNETHTISSTSPYSVDVTNLVSWQSDLGVRYTVGSVALTATNGDPAAGQYTIIAGKYYFNSTDAGKSVQISYISATSPTQAAIENPQHLDYIDYDFWRQIALANDLTGAPANMSIPTAVFKTQVLGQIGITPVPDKIYKILYEYWLDAIDLSATTDVSLIPTRFDQVIIQGASAYVYKYREDLSLAGMADKKFQEGIARMRTELINRRDDIRSGMRWPRRGMSYMLTTPMPR